MPDHSSSDNAMQDYVFRFHEMRLRRKQLESELACLELELKAASRELIRGGTFEEFREVEDQKAALAAGLPAPPLRFEVSGRPLYVIDGLASTETVERVHTAFVQLKYGRNEVDRTDTQSVRTFSAEIPAEFRSAEPLFLSIDRMVAALFPAGSQTCYRAYVNCIVYGDSTFMHSDCRKDRPDITAIYYANRDWQPSWAGETIFFDDTGDARYAIAPRPGRVAIFQGATPHRSGIPSRDCFEERLTLAVKYTPAV
jgi:SM-20-related protein